MKRCIVSPALCAVISIPKNIRFIHVHRGLREGFSRCRKRKEPHGEDLRFFLKFVRKNALEHIDKGPVPCYNARVRKKLLYKKKGENHRDEIRNPIRLCGMLEFK